MKKLLSITLLAILTFTSSCSQTNQSGTTIDIDAKGPSIKFEVLEHDFGTIKKGGDGTFEFVFKNEGSETLLLHNVRPSCGCTTPSWPKEPIPAGKESKITVKYDTNRDGPFNKSISVYSNAGDTPIVLKIKGNVVAATKPQDQASKE